VSEQSAENQMTAHNLAIVIGPSLMWSDTTSLNSMQTVIVHQGKLVEYFITNRHQLFDGEAKRL